MALRYTKATAIFSKDGKKRYQLYREWDTTKGALLFILFNPSTASATQDDPTLRRVVGFASSWGFGSVLVGNLYPFCSSNPKNVPQRGTYDKKNTAQLAAMCAKVTTVVYAWGQNHPVPDWLAKLVAKPNVLALTKTGIPKHPLYLPASTQLQSYKI